MMLQLDIFHILLGYNVIILVNTSSEALKYPTAGRQGYGYAAVHRGVHLQSASTDVELLKVGRARSKLECAVTCYSDEVCHYVQYSKISGECMLFKMLSPSSVDPVYSDDEHSEVIAVGQPYLSQDGCSSLMPSDYYSCPLYSNRCKPLSSLPSGIYTMDVEGNRFDVYCDLELDGGGWTVFQRRVDATLGFYRPWAQYVAGFGDLSANLWLGLDKLHLLSQDGVELHVYLEMFNGSSAYAYYSQFSVASGLDNYRLTVGGYSGTAGDGLAIQSGQQFSTYDQDHDVSPSNCAIKYTGAWWYEMCHQSNLNGQYLGGQHRKVGIGVGWLHYMGHRYSYKTAVMKLRSVVP